MSVHMQFDNLSDFLKASPFDPEYDLNRTLTEAAFYEHFFVDLGRMTELIAGFKAIIEGTAAPNRLIFLKGYAGHGKTTFVRTFMDRTKDVYRPVYFDIQQQRRSARKAVAEREPATDEVQLLMNRELRSMKDAPATFRFLYDHREALREQDFISPGLNEYLDAMAPGEFDGVSMRKCTDRFDLKDTFAALFIHLFRTSTRGQKTIVFFDTLDAAPMEYLADRFLVYFEDALLTGIPLARHALFADREINFRHDYRFVFTLRDANEAVLNAHIGERVGLNRIPFEVSFDPASYNEVAAKRIRYLATKLPENDDRACAGGKFSTVFSAILHDSYFQDVLLPLFNFDYREVTGVLARIVDRHNIADTEGKLGPRVRGALPFGLIQDLFEHNFLSEYRHVQADDSGYCFIDRVMLTVLINKSRYKRASRRSDGSSQPDESEPYSLLHLVRELDAVYHDVEGILESIGRCFLFHQKGWIHLLTLMNRPVEKRTEFVKTYRMLISHAMTDAERIDKIKIRNELNTILARPNPAGFTYVRYILPHFEFYSNLAKNESSLFDNPFTRSSASDPYAFETKIDAVLRIVRKHVRNMKQFFDTRYMDAKIAENFAQSDFAFRHAGPVLLGKKHGHSHTIRVATSHIGYIDFFRRSMVEHSSLDVAEKQRVNDILAAKIREYVRLLHYAPDQLVGDSLAKEFEVAIQKVAKSDRPYATPIARE
jgi:hypothetical protein